MKRATRYPKTLYIRRVTEGSETWLEAYEAANDVADISEVVEVAVYELVCTKMVTTRVEVK